MTGEIIAYRFYLFAIEKNLRFVAIIIIPNCINDGEPPLEVWRSYDITFVVFFLLIVRI